MYWHLEVDIRKAQIGKNNAIELEWHNAKGDTLASVFSHSQMTTAGARFMKLQEDDMEIGTVYCGNQGRARLQNEHAGRVNLYAQRKMP